jgi:hypothetical protein
MTTSVMDLDAGEEHATFSLNARESVIAAYAQSRGDLNTWNYESKYGKLARKTKYGWTCGKYWAQQDINVD